MIRRNIKTVTIEYEDGTILSYSDEGMYHKIIDNFPGGANPKEETRYKQHEIHWTAPLEG